MASSGKLGPTQALFKVGADATSGTLAWPAGTAAGDFALYFYSVSTTTIVEADVNPGSGWTLLRYEATSSTQRLWLYGKILTSTDIANPITFPTGTASRVQLHIYAVGGSNFTLLESQAVTGSNTNGSLVLAARNCSIAAAFRNGVWNIDSNGATDLSISPSSGWTTRIGANAQNRSAYFTDSSIPSTTVASSGGTSALWLVAVTIGITA